jgi:uncharacterized membrane protein
VILSGNSKLKHLALWSQAAFYAIAGVNHFINPEFYYPLIPDYLPWKAAINLISGVAEIGLGLFLLIPVTRKIACFALMAMLVAFIPSHVYFISIGSCVDGGLCVAPWIGWLRLLVIHPILIFGIWWLIPHSDKTKNT